MFLLMYNITRRTGVVTTFYWAFWWEKTFNGVNIIPIQFWVSENWIVFA